MENTNDKTVTMREAQEHLFPDAPADAQDDTEPNGKPLPKKAASTKKRKGHRISAPVLLVVCALAIATTGSLMWYAFGSGTGRDSGATISNYEGMTHDEIQAELNKIVKENMMVVSVAPTARIKDDGSLRVNVENDSDNKFDQRFSIIQDDKVRYESGTIEPGQIVETCSADGIHEGKASIEIQAVDKETHKDHGSPMRVDIKVAKMAA